MATAHQTIDANCSQEDDLYPHVLMDEYQELIEKKFRRALTSEESDRLVAVREEINSIDRQRLRPNTWDLQCLKLRKELAQLRAEAEALPKG